MRSEYCTRCFLVIVINELGTRPAHRDERLPSLMAARRKVRSQHTHTAGTCFMESLSFPPAMSSGMFCCVSQPVRQTSCHPLARRTVAPERCSPASGQGVGPCPERQEQKHVLQASPPHFSSRVGDAAHGGIQLLSPRCHSHRGETFLPARRVDRDRLPTPPPSSLVSPWQPEGFLKNSFRLAEKRDNGGVFTYATPHVPLVNADKVRLSQ